MIQAAKSDSDILSKLTRSSLRFLGWWTGELSAMIPNRVRQWWSGAERVLFLRFDDAGRALFERATSAGMESLLSLDPLDKSDAVRYTKLGTELSQRMNGSFRIWLCLANDLVLRRSITLPMAVEENLRQTLAFEIDRYTPFKPDQVYFAYRIVARDMGQNQLTIEIAVAKRSVLDQEMARVSALGLPIDGVMPFDCMLSSDRFLNLMPNAASSSSAGPVLGVRLMLLVTAFLMLGMLLAIPVWQKRAAAISLLSPLAEAKAAANETEKMREQLDKLVAEHNLLPDRKWLEHSPLMVLAELSKLLPDDSFVNAVDFDGKTVQIQGESLSAASLVETLDASPLFKEVAFKAPVAKIQGTAGDRFHISAALEPGARPKPVTGDTLAGEKP